MRTQGKRIIDSITKSLEDLPLTIGELCRRNTQYSYVDLIECVNAMMSKGLLESKGDGFAVYYSLTHKAYESGSRRS